MSATTSKYVIAGAGEYGRKAAKYYGFENIAFFVDRSTDKHGKDIYGIRICPYSELENDSSKYTVIVAANNYEAIITQINAIGIKDYIVFSPTLAEKMKLIPSPEKSDDKIVLFGFDIYIKQFINEFKNRGWKSENIIIAERERIIEVCNNETFEVKSIDSLDISNSTVFVSSMVYSYGIEQYRKRKDLTPNKWINLFVDESYYPSDELVINPYTSSTTETSEEKWVRDRNVAEAKERLQDYYDELEKELPLFSHIEIETVNRCNGKCSFCPVSVGHDIRPYTVMEDTLFYKIIDELSELKYTGKIALFSNNEPFIDKRIIFFHEYARKKLPLARFHLFTNGTLLTLEKFISVIAYLDELIIDNYNQKLELNKSSREIYEYVMKHPELISKVDIVIRKEEEILNTRGGDAPNREMKVSYDDITCTHPLRQIIIRPDGKVSLCCNDPYGKMTLGDANNDSLEKIWYGKKFAEVRDKLKKGRGNIALCKYCDYFGCK